MKINLILTGKTTSKTFQAIIDDYSERVTHYTPFAVTVIPELKNTKALSQEQQKQMEGELILRQLQDSDYVVLLDEHGKELRSIEFATWISKKQQAVSRRLVFVIGGPYGFSPAIYQRADEKLSLSKMTFSLVPLRADCQLRGCQGLAWRYVCPNRGR